MNSEPDVVTATAQTPIVQEAVIDPAALARGDAVVVEAFYRELFEPIYGFVFWRVGGVRQDAEDVTQETFVTALGNIGRFEGRSSLYVWVCGIAKNLAHARLRARRRPDGDPARETSAGVQAAPDHLLERAQTDHLVGRALTELPPHYQRALLDKYVRHRSFAEMAAEQRCSAKAVESTVQRAKRALAAALARVGLDHQDGTPRSHDDG
jgi:RNA polymerase sigma-70 factor (ECF subfamily)